MLDAGLHQVRLAALAHVGDLSAQQAPVVVG